LTQAPDLITKAKYAKKASIMVKKDLLRQPSIDQKRDDSVNNLKRFYKKKILIQFWHGLTLTVPAKVKSVKY
jgi:hypothetical protein